MISALAFAVLVLASSASAFDAQALQKHLDLKEKFQAMHAPMKAALNDFHAQAHGMNVQAKAQFQDKSPKCVNISRAIYGQYNAACGKNLELPWFSDNQPASDTAAQAQLDAFAAKTACINLFKQMTAPANRSCFDGTTTTAHDLILFLASPTTKGSDGATCGMQYMRFSRMFGGCEKYNSSWCQTAAPFCKARSGADLPDEQEWGSQAGGTKTPEPATTCKEDWGTAAFGKICTGCFAKFLAQGKETMDSSSNFYGFFTTFAKQICGAKSPKGKLCYPLLMPKVEAAAGNPFASTTAMDGFCTGPEAREYLPCIKRLFSSGASNDKIEAVRQFKTCWRANANTTARAGCMNAYKKAMYNVKQRTLQSKFLCSKNPAAANTQYCFTAHHKLHHNSNGCYNKARTGQTCSSCQAGLQTAVDGMGCCAGLIQTYYTAPRKLTKADYPRMHGFQPPADFTPDQIGSTAPLRAAKAGERLTKTSGTGYMALMARCGVTGLNETLRFMCGGAKFKRTGKKLGLKIKFNSLHSTQKETLKSAMKTDVANNLGLSEDEIVNDELVEDTSISVSGSTAGRVMELESANSGTQYTFDIEAEDDASATAASESFDSLAADDGFDLAETEYELDESVSTTAVSTSTTTSQYSDMTSATSAAGSASGSGASAPAQLLAALVILAASLLAF
jgi:hypothetical protein